MTFVVLLILGFLYVAGTISNYISNIKKKIEVKKPCRHGIKGALKDTALCEKCDAEQKKAQAEIAEQKAKIELARYRKWVEQMRLPDYLHNIDPLEFEVLVGRLFERMGYEVEMTPRTGDGGVDMFLVKPDGAKAVVQCKRFKGTVGEPVLRDLFGAMHDAHAEKALLVTTGRVSTPGHDWAKGKPIEIIEFLRLKKMLEANFPIDAIVPPGIKPLLKENEVCPRCKNLLRLVYGRRGPFIGCQSYPNCRYTRPAPAGAPWDCSGHEIVSPFSGGPFQSPRVLRISPNRSSVLKIDSLVA